VFIGGADRRGWLLAVLPGVVISVVFLIGFTWSAGASGARSSRRPHLGPPELLSLRYGRFRPGGAGHAYFAMKLRVYVRGGQVVETDFHELPSGFNGVGDSACGIGGRKDGDVETFFVPVMPVFARGIHRVRVTAVASSCSARVATASASRTFRLTVR